MHARSKSFQVGLAWLGPAVVGRKNGGGYVGGLFPRLGLGTYWASDATPHSSEAGENWRVQIESALACSGPRLSAFVCGFVGRDPSAGISSQPSTAVWRLDLGTVIHYLDGGESVTRSFSFGDDTSDRCQVQYIEQLNVGPLTCLQGRRTLARVLAGLRLALKTDQFAQNVTYEVIKLETDVSGERMYAGAH